MNLGPQTIVKWIILAATKIFAPTLAQGKKKCFLNPPMGNIPITEESGQVTIGAS